MNEEKRAGIERLSIDLHNKRETFYALGAMNRPSDPEEAKASLVRYNLARAEMVEAQLALDKAINLP